MKSVNKQLSSDTSHESAENGFSQQRKEEISRAVVEGRSAGERLYERGYKDEPDRNGMALYLKTKMGAYDLFTQEECELYRHLSEQLAKIFLSKHIDNCVHLGPGDGHAWDAYIGNLPGALQKLPGKRYVPADVSSWSAKYVGEMIGNKYKMHSDPLIVDWLKTTHLRSLVNKAVLFEGSSFGNFSPKEQEILLHAVATERGRATQLAMSRFVAPDPQLENYQQKVDTLLSAYHTAEVETWIMTGFQEAGLDTSLLEFCVTYMPGNDIDPIAKIKVGAKVKPGQELRVTFGGQQRVLMGGQKLWAISSSRFSPEQIKEIFKRADRRIDELVSGEFVGVILAKSKSGREQYMARHQQKIKTALLTALLTGGAWGANHLRNTHTAQKKIEAKIAYNIQFKNANLYLERFVSDNDTPEKKLERVYQLADNMVTILKTRYASFDFPGDKELRNALALLISQKDNLAKFRNGDMERENMVEFVDHVFWPSYTSSTAALEHTTLYEHLAQYEPIMQDLLDHPRDLVMHEGQTVAMGFKWVLMTPKVWNMDMQGKYIDSEGNMYELAVVKKILTSEGTYPELNGEKQLVARQIRGDTPAFGLYTSTTAQHIAQDYFKKGYVDPLVMQLVALPIEESKKRSVMNKGTIQMHHGALHQLLTDVLIKLNRQGYDFSYLLEDGTEELQKRFLYSFLADYTGLTEAQRAVLLEYRIGKQHGSETKEVSLSQAVDRLTAYLDTYFFSGKRDEQDLFGLKKELTREMLQNQDIERKYQKITDATACFDYLYQRKELCARYGFKLQTWQDFADREPGFRKLLEGSLKQQDDAGVMPGELNYFNNFYRCADGRVFSIAGNWHELRALEITPTNNHRAIEQCLPDIKEQLTKKRGTGLWSLEGSNRGEHIKQDEVIRFINNEYIPFSQETASSVAQDYFEQKYGEKIADELSTYLVQTCAPGKKELHGAVKQLLSKTIVQLMLTYTLSPREIATAQESDSYRTTLLYYFLVPECKDELEKMMGMSIDGELPYVMTDQLKFVPLAVQEFIQTFGVMKNGMTNQSDEAHIAPEKSMQELPEEQRKVAQTMLKIVATLSPEKYDLKTHLGRYKFFMEYAQDFESLGYTYHDRYFSFLQADINKIISGKNKESTIESLGSEYARGVYYIVTPQGKYQMARAVDKAWGSSPIYARPIFSKQERNDIMSDLKKEFALKWGGGQVSSAESQRVQSTFEERYVLRSTSQAKKLFDELYTVYGDALFEKDPADREGTAF